MKNFFILIILLTFATACKIEYRDTRVKETYIVKKEYHPSYSSNEYVYGMKWGKMQWHWEDVKHSERFVICYIVDGDTTKNDVEYPTYDSLKVGSPIHLIYKDKFINDEYDKTVLFETKYK
jgi:hypothetical protein